MEIRDTNDNDIDVLSDYLKEINKKVENLKEITGAELFAFRGEQEKYPVPCMPNIFRNQHADRIRLKEDYFEKNIILRN